MKRLDSMKIKLKPFAAAVALSLAASPTFAVDYYLAAKAYDKTLPDGSSVPMWGYVLDTANCFGAASDAARLTCIGTLPDPVAQGPRLVVPPNQTALRVYLSNGLPEPTSLMIPGHKLPVGNYPGISPVSGPTWNDGSTGNRTGAAQRVRSFVPEAPANGGKMGYIWNNNQSTPIDRSGTFIYHSGTHPQKQVYMGLAGMMTHDAAAGEVYPGVSYSNEVELFYSDIDPSFNAAVAAGTLTTAMGRHPTWFLINGEPFQAGFGDIANGSNGPLTASSNTLLRLASTASENHVVVMQGMDLTLHGEDGLQYNWQDATGTAHPAPRKQYSAMLPPAKTKDAMVFAPANGRYAIYDGNGYMTNPSDPGNETVGDTLGGMLRFLAFGAGSNAAPAAMDDAASVVAGFATNIAVLSNDADPESDPLSIASFDATGATGGVNCTTGVVGGTCSYDATGVAAGTVDTFTYVASDGTSSSAAATVTVTVTANQVPTANADAAATSQDVAVIIDVIANDTDPEGQPLTVAGFDAISTGGQAVSCAGTSCTYTPAGGYTGVDTFTYTATDGPNTSAAATVTVTVTAPNTVPVANDDVAATNANAQVIVDVLANDVDGDGDTLTIAGYDAASTQGGSVACVTGVVGGACTYTPATDFTGIDTFTYTATDGTDTSAPATVTVTVSGAAAPALYFSTIGAGSVPGVAGPYDDADIYTVDGANIFGRQYDGVSDLGLPNNADIDGLSINGTTLYVSFAGASTNVPGVGNVPDEDVVQYDTVAGTWSTYFDGSLCGLDTNNGQDIDAVSVSGGTLYFSTVGGGNRNSVTGVAGPYDDADVYAWNGVACSRAVDGSAAGLPGNADIDALTVSGNLYYMSFNRDGGTSVPGVGTVEDESVVVYDSSTGTWSSFPTGADQLNGTNSQDVNAIHVP